MGEYDLPLVLRSLGLCGWILLPADLDLKVEVLFSCFLLFVFAFDLNDMTGSEDHGCRICGIVAGTPEATINRSAVTTESMLDLIEPDQAMNNKSRCFVLFVFTQSEKLPQVAR